MLTTTTTTTKNLLLPLLQCTTTTTTTTTTRERERVRCEKEEEWNEVTIGAFFFVESGIKSSAFYMILDNEKCRMEKTNNCP